MFRLKQLNHQPATRHTLPANRGQTLVELLLALGIFALIMTAVISLVFAGLTTNLRSLESDHATLLAQEGLDAARSIRDRDWDAFAVAGTYGVSNASGRWEWSGTSDTTVDGRTYTREVSVENAGRNADNSLFTGIASVDYDFDVATCDGSASGYTCDNLTVEMTGSAAQLKQGSPEITVPQTNLKALYHMNATSGAEANKEGLEIENNATGLVGMYHMNGTLGSIANGAVISDSQTNIAANNGTASNGGSGMAYAAGKLKEAVSLDGSNDSVDVVNGFSTNTIAGDDTHTIELWVYPRSVANQPTLYDAYQLAGGYDMFLEISNASTNIMYWGVGGGSTNYRTYRGTVLSVNQWHHIVAVKTGAGNNGDLYIDGVLQQDWVNAGTGLGSTPSGPSNLYFGRYRSGAYYLNGNMDEVALYNTALTAADVVDHFNRGRVFDAEGTGVNTGTLSTGASGNAAAWSNATGTNAKLGGQALSFDGVDDYVTLPNLGISGAAARTIEFWVKPGTKQGRQEFFTSGANASGQRFNILFDYADEVLEFATWGFGEMRAPAGALTRGSWNHVVVTYDGGSVSPGIKIYINGVSQSLTLVGSNGALNTTNADWMIGNYTATPSQADAKIDEFAIYNVVLSPSEISSHHASQSAGTPLTGKEPGLVALYHFNDGGSSATAADSRGDHGFITGPTTVTGNTGLNQALEFDGTDDYVDVGTGINIANSNFTIEAWVKRTGSGNWDLIYGQGTNTANNGLHFGFRDTNVFTCAFYGNDLDTVATYTDNGWHHWACTYNATTRERIIYRDGSVVASGTASANYMGTGIASIGRRPVDNALHFGGRIDDLAVWGSVLGQPIIQSHASTFIGYTSGQIVQTYAQSRPDLGSFKEFVETTSFPAGTSIDYQISADGCATKYSWDGSAWVANGGFNSAQTINQRLSLLPISFYTSQNICVVARLNTADTSQTPILDNLQISYNQTGGINDPGTKKITSRVKWSNGIGVQDVTLTEYLSDWAYQDFLTDTQADFSTAGGSSSGLTLDANGTVYLTTPSNGLQTYSRAPINTGGSNQFMKASWDIDTLPASTTLTLQVRSAPDVSGSPGSWTAWNSYSMSAAGAGQTTLSTVPSNQWVQFQVVFDPVGTGTTPVLDLVNIRTKVLY